MDSSRPPGLPRRPGKRCASHSTVAAHLFGRQRCRPTPVRFSSCSISSSTTTTRRRPVRLHHSGSGRDLVPAPTRLFIPRLMLFCLGRWKRGGSFRVEGIRSISNKIIDVGKGTSPTKCGNRRKRSPAPSRWPSLILGSI